MIAARAGNGSTTRSTDITRGRRRLTPPIPTFGTWRSATRRPPRTATATDKHTCFAPAATASRRLTPGARHPRCGGCHTRSQRCQTSQNTYLSRCAAARCCSRETPAIAGRSCPLSCPTRSTSPSAANKRSRGRCRAAVQPPACRHCDRARRFGPQRAHLHDSPRRRCWGPRASVRAPVSTPEGVASTIATDSVIASFRTAPWAMRTRSVCGRRFNPAVHVPLTALRRSGRAVDPVADDRRGRGPRRDE